MNKIIIPSILGIVIVVAIIAVGSSLVNYNMDDSKYLEKFDMDSDGLVDSLDVFSEDPDEWADFDFDGIGSNADSDDDNDGVLDEYDKTSVVVSRILTEKYLNQIQKCSIIGLTESPQICFANLFAYALKEGESTQDVLDLTMSLSSIGVLTGCHPIIHRIAQSAYEKDPNFIENVLERGSLHCRGAYIHGSMKAFFLDMKEQGHELADFEDGCDAMSYTEFYLFCLHGVGHGFVAYYDGNLNSALNDCVAYQYNYPCSSGAIMEYVGQKVTHSSTLESEISEICSENMDSAVFRVCNRQLGKMLAYFNNNDPEIVSGYCEMIESEQGKFSCHEGFSLALILTTEDRENWISKFSILEVLKSNI